MKRKERKQKAKKSYLENGNYTIIHNSILEAKINDKQLSLQAIGLYAYIKSKPPKWHFSERNIALQLNISNKTIGKYLNELESFGLLDRTQRLNEAGDFDKIQYDIKKTFSTTDNIKSRAVILGARQSTAHKKDLKEVRLNKDILKDKGTFSSPRINNHILTTELIKAKIISALDKDIKKLDKLFYELDAIYNIYDILDGTRYLRDYLKENKKHKTLISVYAYFSVSLKKYLNNIDINKDRKQNNDIKSNYKKTNRPQWFDAFIREELEPLNQ